MLAPGGIGRELGHCVQRLSHAATFVPLALPPAAADDPVKNIRDAKLSMKEVPSRDCTVVASKCDTLAEAAAQLGIHRNTVAEHIDHERLEKWHKPK